jgi:hypothetical protein
MSAIEISEEEVDMKFKNIAKSYIKSWFFLDLLGKPTSLQYFTTI